MITGLPVIGVGSVGLRAEDLFGSGPASLARLSRLRDRGEFDLLAVGRALLANPDLVDRLAAAESAGIVDYRKQQELIFP